MDFAVSTQIPEQIQAVDSVGLFTNPWFLVPLIILIGYLLFKQEFKDLVLIAIFIGAWVFSGSDYLASTSVDGELQLEKVLPIVFGGAVIMGIVVYMYFGRSD
jgi:ascorbate-specific PTS system EIIC-type component UlaA